MTARRPTWPVAAGSLVLGFAVADLTGVRALGGLVLLAGAAWCARRWLPAVGAPRTAALLVLGLALFAASHPLGDVLGSWPAVAVVAATAGAAAWLVADRRAAYAAPARRRAVASASTTSEAPSAASPKTSP